MEFLSTFSLKLSSFQRKRCLYCDLAGAATGFVRAVILKRILGKSIEHCGSEACVLAHHANE